MFSKKLAGIFGCLLLLLLCIANASEAVTLNVAVVVDGNSEFNRKLIDEIGKETDDLIGEENKILFPVNARLDGSWDLTKIESLIQQAMKDNSIDAVLCIGHVSSNVLAKMKKFTKPAFATQILNASMQKVSEEVSENLNYIDLAIDFNAHLATFHELKTFKKLGFIAGDSLLQGLPELVSSIRETLQRREISLITIPAGEVLRKGADALKNLDAVYVAPLPEESETSQQKIVDSINAAKLSSMSMVGSNLVEKGILISITESINVERLAKRQALNLQSLLLDEKPSTPAVAVSHDERLHINMKTARVIEVFPTWSQMTDAIILNAEAQNIERNLSLNQVIETAVIRNLQLAAKLQELEANRQGIERARSNLRPKLSLFGRENVIDEDRAASILNPARYQTQIGAELVQVIYSEQAKANVDIQRLMHMARKEEERGLILDIMKDAALAYLNVLKARTLQVIQKDNLEVTRANLEIAKLRERVGTSGPAEVYRWEIQMASARQAIIDASVIRKKAELSLNQILNASQEEEFTTAESDIYAKVFLLDQTVVAPYIDNVFGYRIFRDFMVGDAFALSPEIQQLQKSIEAQKRSKVSAKRRYNRPTVVLQGNFARTVKETGVGGTRPAIPAPFGFAFSYPDKNDWYVGLNVSIPLYEGGDRPAAVKQAEAGVRQLENNLDYLKQRLELNTRATLEDARSSFSSIRLSNTRSEYAAKTLDLVQRSYSKGVANILDLIDAQNASLVAKEASANAMFNFFCDFVRICRAVGSFDFILKKDSQTIWQNRLKEYYKARL
ncbi:MAG: hypothetical protein GQF41_4495 [Candidatus Rifleibacterium amylolyticum]|nr:MAG: hypothetical protein GQF41_4495 [Candidatus Rifleibacterium amylolyticum]